MISSDCSDPATLPASGPGGVRAVERCDALGIAPYSEEPDRLFRPYLSAAYRATRDSLAGWMQAAGMKTRVDAAGNLVGRYEGLTPDAPALLIGSHIDSVRDAGRYDGMLGVLLGVEVVARYAALGQRFPFAIEVIGFGDEEGSRFPVSMLTSRAVAGLLKDVPTGMQDAAGVSLQAALAEEGLELEHMPEAARKPGEILAYLEAHIEQGPVLEAENRAVGVVTAIAAQYRFRVSVQGVAGHAGTMPMTLRQDALAAAAEAVLAIETIGQSGPSDLVATVGQLTVAPGVPNVVPGEVVFSIDVRAGDAAVRNAAAAEIRTALEALAVRRKVTLDMTLQQDLPATPCDAALTNLLSNAARTTIGDEPRRMVSGAGHDAMVVAALAPVCMLFIRCEGGISHNPAEAVDPSDVDQAFLVMTRFIEDFAGHCP
nr:allantoate amidohydrolase [uncultured Acetobacter sp.]